MTGTAFDPTGAYVHLDQEGGARAITVTPTFWQELGAGEHMTGGRLVAAFHTAEDMSHWEVHPNGDELLLAQSGVIDVILDEPGGPRTITLAAGAAFIVPKGIWHRLEVREPGLLVFITAGEGTEHRPLSSG